MDAEPRAYNLPPTTAASLAPALASSLKTAAGRIVVLFKLRVVVLLVLASVGGALLASGGHLPLSRLIVLIVTGTLSSAGASAINQYLERASDGQMQRTRQRPLAIGEVGRPQTVLEISVVLIILAETIALPIDRALAFFLGAGAIIYVGVYTVWLKPRTVLNIVIGGAAGSCAVLSGGAAGGNWADPGVIALALLVLAWTPTHFWSLAQAYRDDYARADVPMLPVIVNARSSAWWIALHTGLTGFIALMLSTRPALGWVYAVPTIAATVWLGWHSIRLVQRPDRPRAFTLFKVSNIYLGIVLLAIYIGTLV
jgi:protoheme IX farnesyltransferase